MEFKRIAVDTSKHVFALYGEGLRAGEIMRRTLRRAQVEPFFAALAPTEVVLEACGGSHHWGRVLRALGHRVRLIPPQYVTPFVKRGKNDDHDAQAICEAAGRPDINAVPVKSAEQQAERMVLSLRDATVRRRTQLVNALRGHAAEFGIVVAKGVGHAGALRARLEADPAVPAIARAMFACLGADIDACNARLAELDCKLAQLHKANPVSQLLADVPGLGTVGAMTLALTIDPKQFKSGRHFAAWIGLTPREHSTGGRRRLGAISRAGNERLRQLLVLGATAVVRCAKPGARHAMPWLLGLLGRGKPRKLAAVALANKMARIAWAMMTSGEAYRGGPKSAPMSAPAA